MMCISNIYHDSSLYGHYFTSLPQAMWDAATGDKPVLVLDYKVKAYLPSVVEEAKNWAPWFKETSTTSTRTADGRLLTTFHAKIFLPVHYLDLGLRRMVMPLCAPIVSLMALPLGFAIKVIHQVGRSITS